LVYGDLVGWSRPVLSRPRAGVCWCRLWRDVRAAKESGMSLFKWLPWALSCEAKSAIAWDDPLPLLGAALKRVISQSSFGNLWKKQKTLRSAADSDQGLVKSDGTLVQMKRQLSRRIESVDPLSMLTP